MIGNRSLIAKADLALSDLLTSGGALVASQARRLIRTLIDKSVVMPSMTVIPQKAPQHRIERARFGSRVLRAGSEAQALTKADRAKLDLAKVELNAQLFKAEVRLDNETLEDSIEGGNLKNTVIALLSERISLDMDEMIVKGDTASGDPFLAKFDGLIKLASVNTVNNASAILSKTTLKNMIRAMPSEFMRNRGKMRFWVSTDTETEYRDGLASRATGLGDLFLQQDISARYSGIPILDVPVFPEDLGGGNDEGVVLMLEPKNAHAGIWRRVTMETDKDISAGVMIIVVSIRFDAKYADPTAVVKAINVKV